MSKRPKIEVGPLPTPESIQAPAFAGVLSAAAARSAQQAKLRVKQWIGGTAVVLMLAIGVAYWVANRPSVNAPEPPNLAPGQTLVPGVELPTLRVVFNAEAGADLALSDGTTIRLKPNALRHADGSPVTGPVELVYVPMRNPAHFALSGIQMEAPTPGRVLESAAMFQLECNQQGQPLELDPALPVEMTLPSRFADDGIKLYKYDRATQAWSEEGVSRPAVRFTFHETYPGIFRHPLHRTAWEVSDSISPEAQNALFRNVWTKISVVGIDSVANLAEFEIRMQTFEGDSTVLYTDAIPESEDTSSTLLTEEISGVALFKANCASCHKPTNARGTGPGLAGVMGRWNYNETELIAFIRGGAKAYADGDREFSQHVRNLIAEFGTVMPAQPISNEDAMAILEYLGGPAAPSTAPVRFLARPVGTTVTVANVQLLLEDFAAQQRAEYDRQRQLRVRAQDSLMRYWANETSGMMMQSNVLQVVSIVSFGVWNCDREINSNEVMQNVSFTIDGQVLPADSLRQVVAVWKGLNTAVYGQPKEMDWSSSIWDIRLSRETNDADIWVVTRGSRLGKARVHTGIGVLKVPLEMMPETDGRGIVSVSQFLGVPLAETRPPIVVSGPPSHGIPERPIEPPTVPIDTIPRLAPDALPEGNTIRFCVWVMDVQND